MLRFFVGKLNLLQLSEYCFSEMAILIFVEQFSSGQLLFEEGVHGSCYLLFIIWSYDDFNQSSDASLIHISRRIFHTRQQVNNNAIHEWIMYRMSFKLCICKYTSFVRDNFCQLIDYNVLNFRISQTEHDEVWLFWGHLLWDN